MAYLKSCLSKSCPAQPPAQPPCSRTQPRRQQLFQANSVSNHCFFHTFRSFIDDGAGAGAAQNHRKLDAGFPRPPPSHTKPWTSYDFQTLSVVLEHPAPPSPHSKTIKIIGFHTSSIIFEPPRAPPHSPKPFKSPEFPIKPWVWGCLNTSRLLHKTINILQISSNFCGSRAARVTFKRIIWFLGGAGGSRTNPSSDLGLLRCYSAMRQWLDFLIPLG